MIVARAPRITSPTHAVGVAMVIAQAVIAVQLLTGMTTQKALRELVGDGLGQTVPVTMLATALIAIVAIVGVTTSQRPAQVRGWLRVEAGAKAWLGGASLAYALSLTHTYGWSGGATTQTYAWALGVGFCARAAQIIRDLAVLQPSAPVGEPDHLRG